MPLNKETKPIRLMDMLHQRYISLYLNKWLSVYTKNLCTNAKSDCLKLTETIYLGEKMSSGLFKNVFRNHIFDRYIYLKGFGIK